jgi:hypothetical protein
MAVSPPNAAISDAFGDASDAVIPTSAFVIPAASRTNALANEAKSASGTLPPWGAERRVVRSWGQIDRGKFVLADKRSG